MTREDHAPFTHIVETWLDSPDAFLDPDAVLGRVMAQVDTRPQRQARWPEWRIPHMNKFVTIGLGAAAVVVVLLVGPNLLGSSSPPPGGAPSEPESSVEPSAGAELPVGRSFDLTATGADTDDAFITVTIPAPGWFGEPGEGSVTKDLGGDASARVVALLHEWYRVPSDICRWQSSDETPRPDTMTETVDEMVAALAAQTHETPEGSLTRQPSTPVDITIDGEPGQSITLVVPSSDPDDCDEQRFCSLMNRDGVCWLSHQPGDVETLWIVQSSDTFGGPNPWLVAASYSPTVTSELRAEVTAIVESITTEYPHPPLTQSFTSTQHGISVSYPEGWTADPASEPWTALPVSSNLGRPVIDVLSDPNLGYNGPFLAIASQPIGDSPPEDWVGEQIASERGCGVTTTITVDGASGLTGGDGCTVVVVTTAGRGYWIQLYTGSEAPLAYDYAWFEEVLATVQLHPEDAVD